MIAVPPVHFLKIIRSIADGTRPLDPEGTVVTPGNNSYGSYAQIIAGASLTDTAYGILIKISDANATGVARDCLVTIGIDPAGGTSYTDWIQHLVCTAASDTRKGGIVFFFPLLVPAGASLAAKASVNNATVGEVSVSVTLLCQPTGPVEVGTGVQTFGAVTATSKGTDITPGNAAEGDWVELGTLDRPIFYWEGGLGFNQSAIGATRYEVDLGVGDGSNKRQAALFYVHADTNEDVWKSPGLSAYGGKSGDKVYARAQAGPNNAVTGVSAIAYGVYL